MSSRDVDAFLAESQEVLDDYVTWHGSADSATWTADGSHEPDQIGGDYYGDDYPDGFNDSWGQPHGGGTSPAHGLFQVLSPTFQHYAEGGEIPPSHGLMQFLSPNEPPEVTRAWDRIRETVARPVLTTLRMAYRDRYIHRLRYVEHATDIHDRVSRARAVWDNPLSQEDS